MTEFGVLYYGTVIVLIVLSFATNAAKALTTLLGVTAGFLLCQRLGFHSVSWSLLFLGCEFLGFIALMIRELRNIVVFQ